MDFSYLDPDADFTVPNCTIKWNYQMDALFGHPNRLRYLGRSPQVTYKDGPTKISLRRSFRRCDFKINVGIRSLMPCVIAAREIEHNEGVPDGAEGCNPYLSHLEEKALRNFFLLYLEGKCGMQVPADKDQVSILLNKTHLITEDPAYGGDQRFWYRNKRPNVEAPLNPSMELHDGSLQFMKKALKKLGGDMKTIIIKNTQLNPYLSSYVEKIGNDYVSHAQEFSKPLATFECAHCGMINFVWLEDMETGVHGQHCGCCWFPLDKHAEKIHTNYVLADCTNEHIQLGSGDVQLSMAEVCNMYDGEIPVSEATMSYLMEQDYKNLKVVMSRYHQVPFKVQNGMTQLQYNKLVKQCTGLTLVPNRSSPNKHAMIASERKLCHHFMVERIGINQTIIDVGTRQLWRTKHKSKFLGPMMDWRDYERYGKTPIDTKHGCDHTVAKCHCHDNSGGALILTDSIYDICAEDILQMMLRVKSELFMFSMSTLGIDFNKECGSLKYNQGEWCRANGRLLTCLNGDDRPYDNDFYLTKMWATSDIVLCNNYEIHLQNYKKIGNHIIRTGQITSNAMHSLKSHFKITDIADDLELNLPMVDALSWVNLVKEPIIQYKTVKINVNLFRCLYTRNLTAGMSFQKLVEYGLAYAHSKYTTSSRVISHQEVTADDVRSHAFMAMIITRRKFNWIDHTMFNNNPSESYSSVLLKGGKDVIIDYLLQLIKEYVKEHIGLLEQSNVKLSGMLWMAQCMIRRWINMVEWEKLEQLVKGIKIEKLTVDCGDRTVTETQVTTSMLCCHHKNTCVHPIVIGVNACECCGMHQQQLGNKCKCCSDNKVICNHICKHLCNGIDSHRVTDGNVICKCCGVVTGNEMCDYCVKFGKPIYGMEPPSPHHSESENEDDTNTAKKANYKNPKPKVLGKVKTIKRNKINIGQQSVETQKQKKVEVPPVETKNVASEEVDYLAMFDEVTEEIEGNKDQEVMRMKKKAAPSTKMQDETKTTDNLVIPPKMSPAEHYYHKLASITNNEYASCVRYGFENCFKNGMIMPGKIKFQNEIAHCEIQYVPTGTWYIDSSNVSVINEYDVPGDGLCGWHCIEKLLPAKAKLERLRQMSGRTNYFSDDDLANYLRDLDVNSVILLPGKTMVTKVPGDNDSFVCIKHSKFDNLPTDHWTLVDAVVTPGDEMIPSWKGMLRIWKLNRKMFSASRSNFYSDVSEAVRVRTVYEDLNAQMQLLMRADSFIEPTIIEIQGKRYVTNNSCSVHSIKDGMLTYEVESTHFEDIKELQSTDYRDLSEGNYMQGFDLPELLFANIDKTVKQYKCELVHQIKSLYAQAKGKLPKERNLWVTTQVTARKRGKGAVKLENLDEKIKAGDMVIIHYRGVESVSNFINLENGLGIPSKYGHVMEDNQKLTITYCKRSMSSLMIQLWNTGKQHANNDQFVELLQNSMCIIGPAGSGKTTKLIEMNGNNTVYVTRTRVARNNIIDTSKRKCSALTFEKYCVVEPKDTTVIIDECTMFNWLDLYLMLRPCVKRLIMAGDPNQIGIIDMNTLAGIRWLTPINHYSKQTTVYNHTYRYGKSLCKIISPVTGQINSLASHDTKVTSLDLQSWDETAIRDIIITHNPDVIITHYNNYKDLISRLTTKEVHTIHSFQSQQRDKVMVIQAKAMGTVGAIWADRNYNVSAATRCKKELIWLSVGVGLGKSIEDKMMGNLDTKAYRGGASEIENITTLSNVLAQNATAIAQVATSLSGEEKTQNRTALTKSEIIRIEDDAFYSADSSISNSSENTVIYEDVSSADTVELLKGINSNQTKTIDLIKRLELTNAELMGGSLCVWPPNEEGRIKALKEEADKYGAELTVKGGGEYKIERFFVALTMKFEYSGWIVKCNGPSVIQKFIDQKHEQKLNNEWILAERDVPEYFVDWFNSIPMKVREGLYEKIKNELKMNLNESELLSLKLTSIKSEATKTTPIVHDSMVSAVPLTSSQIIVWLKLELHHPFEAETITLDTGEAIILTLNGALLAYMEIANSQMTVACTSGILAADVNNVLIRQISTINNQTICKSTKYHCEWDSLTDVQKMVIKKYMRTDFNLHNKNIEAALNYQDVPNKATELTKNIAEMLERQVAQLSPIGDDDNDLKEYNALEWLNSSSADTLTDPTVDDMLSDVKKGLNYEPIRAKTCCNGKSAGKNNSKLEKLNADDNMVETSVILTMESQRRLRSLSETVKIDQIAGYYTRLTINGVDLVLLPLGGCSLCGGIVLRLDNDEKKVLCVVENANPSSWHPRRVKFNTHLHYGISLQLLLALRLLECVEVVGSLLDDNPFESLIVNSVNFEYWYELGSIIDRAREWCYAMKDELTLQSDKAWQRFEESNKKFKQEIVAHIGRSGKVLKRRSNRHNYIDISEFPVAFSALGDHCNVDYLYKQRNTSTMLCTDTAMCKKNQWQYATKRTIFILQKLDTINKWQWKLAKLLLNATLNETSLLGAKLPIANSGFNVPLADHQQKKTSVFDLLQSKRDELAKLSIIKSYNIVFVQQHHHQKYKHLLAAECSNLPVEIQGVDLCERGLDSLVEQIYAKFVYNGMDHGETMTHVTDFPWVSLVNSSWASMSTQYGLEFSDRYKRNLLDCIPLLSRLKTVYVKEKDEEKKKPNTELEKMRKAIEHQESGNGPWYNKKATKIGKCETLLLGLTTNRWSIDQIAECMEVAKVTTANLIMPVKISGEMPYMHNCAEDEKMIHVAYDGAERTHIINKELFDHLMTGKIKRYEKMNFVSHSCGIMMGHGMFQITLVPSQITIPHYVYPLTNYLVEQEVIFEIPKRLSALESIEKGQYLESKQINIDYRLYRALSLRMLRNNTTLDDLLSYARTYAHTVAYSEHGYDNKNVETTEKLMEAAACVFYESSKLNQSIGSTCSLLASGMTSEWGCDQLTSVIKTTGINAMADIYKLLRSDVSLDVVIKNIADSLRTNKTKAIKMLSNLEKIKLIRITPKKKFCQYVIADKENLVEVSNEFKSSLVTGAFRTVWSLMHSMWTEKGTWVTTPDQIKQSDKAEHETLMSKTVENLAKNHLGDDLKIAIESIASNLEDVDLKLQLSEDIGPKLLRNTSRVVTLDPISELKHKSIEGVRNTNFSMGIMIMDNYLETEKQLEEYVTRIKWQYSEEVQNLCRKVIIFSTIGSRGDCEPLINIALFFKKLGAICKLCIPKDLVYMVEGEFEVYPLDISASKTIYYCKEMGKHRYDYSKTINIGERLFTMMGKMLSQCSNSLIEFMKNADVVIETPFTHVACQVGQKMNIPIIFCTPYPWEYHRGVGCDARRKSIWELVLEITAFQPFYEQLKRWRLVKLNLTNERGILPMTGGNPIIYTHSRQLTNWNISNSCVVIGAVNNLRDNKFNDSLDDVMKSKRQKIGITLGSVGSDYINDKLLEMISDQSLRDFDFIMVTDAKTDRKLFESLENVTLLSKVDYNKLFSVCAVTVCHGGCGTSHSALRQGCAVACYPHFGDQIAWSDSITYNKLGVTLKDNQNWAKMITECINLKDYEFFNKVSIIRKEEPLTAIIANWTKIVQTGAKHTMGLHNGEIEPIKSFEINWGDNSSMLGGKNGETSDDSDESSSGPSPIKKNADEDDSSNGDDPEVDGHETSSFSSLEGVPDVQDVKHQQWADVPDEEQEQKTQTQQQSSECDAESENQGEHNPVASEKKVTAEEFVEVDNVNNESESHTPVATSVEAVTTTLSTNDEEKCVLCDKPEYSQLNDIACDFINTTINHNELLKQLSITTTDVDWTWKSKIEFMNYGKLEVVFDPTNVGDCVLDSFQRFLELSNVEVHRDVINHLLGNDCWLNKRELRILVQLLGIKAAILDVDKIVEVYNATNGVQSVLAFNITRHPIGHVKLVKLSDLSTVSSRQIGLEMLDGCEDFEHTQLHKKIDALELKMKNRSFINKCTELFCKVHAAAMLAELNPDLTDKTLHTELAFKNIHYTSMRKKTPLHVIEGLQTIHQVTTTTPSNWKTGDMIIMQGENDWHTGMVSVDGSRSYIYLPTINESTKLSGIALDLMPKWFNKRVTIQKTTIIKYAKMVEGKTITALNNQTMIAMQNLPDIPVCTSVANIDADVLYIYDYDNREHHKYDEITIIQAFQSKEIIGVGFELTGELKKRLMDRESTLRHSIRSGVEIVSMEFECSDTRLHHKFCLGKMKIFPREIGNTLHIDVQNKKSQIVAIKVAFKFIYACKNGLIKMDDLSLQLKHGMTVNDKLLEELKFLEGDKTLIKMACNEKTILKNAQSKKHYALSYHTMTVNDSVQVDKYVWWVKRVGKLLTLVNFKQISAGGVIDQQIGWKSDEVGVPGEHTRWWNVPASHATKLTGKPLELFAHKFFSEAMSGIELPEHQETTNKYIDERSMEKMSNKRFEYVDTHNSIQMWEEKHLWIDDLSMVDIDMWENNDFSDWNDKYAPINSGTIISKIPVSELRESTKTFLTKYPKYSRPVLTKAANQEFNASTGRLYKVVDYRKFKYDLNGELNLFFLTYGCKEWKEKLISYSNDQIGFNDNSVIDWIKDRPDALKISDEVIKILEEGATLHPLNKINFHLKLESLLKEEPVTNMKQVKARALMWQCKGYCAIFSHAFKRVKERLKDVLRHNIVYADGLTANDLAARVRLVTNANCCLENDLSQQDRQTDTQILNFEMSIYKSLGMNESMVNLWRNCHDNWKYKARTIRGMRNAMRLTGQATTAIGNVITNLLVHRSLVQRAGENLKLFLVLGDDGLMLLNRPIDKDRLNNELKNKHNMMCKPQISYKFGQFCCMLVFKVDDSVWDLGPDFVRLKRRYEVTNGVAEVNDDNLYARSMSYAMMLGNIPPVSMMINTLKMPVQPMNWYSEISCMNAVANKYNLSVSDVEMHINSLVEMMTNPTLYQTKFLHWVEGRQ